MKKRVMIIITAVIAVIALVVGLAYTFRSKAVIWNDKVYSSKEEVSSYIEGIRSQEIVIEGNTEKYVLPITNILVASSDDVYRKMQDSLKGNVLKTMFHKPITFDYALELDETRLQNFVSEEISAKENTEPKNSTYTYDSRKVYIMNGYDGSAVNEEQLINDIKSNIEKSDFSNPVRINYDVVEFKKVNSAEIAEEVKKPAVDADISESDGVTKVIKAEEGIELSADEQLTIDNNNSTPGFEFSVPLKKIQPNRAEVDTSALFNTTLSTYSTNFASSSSGRAANVSRATELLNGTIINPGEVFSYSGVVGKPSIERGFAYATVYENNKPVKGIGGGICQVSSTLYNAALLADLDITERQNHSLPVSYVPKGRDATIATGSIDLKFKNNYSFPIKIVTSSSGRVCKISILGKESTGKEVSLKVHSNGTSGGYSNYSLYKTVTQNGAVIKDNVLESKSSYKN